MIHLTATAGLPDWLSVAAAAGSAFAAWQSVRAARAAAAHSRVELTIAMVAEHRQVIEREWNPLSEDTKWRLHLLRWGQRPRTREMGAVVTAFNSGERLAQAWRSCALDSATLLALEAGSGERFDYLSRHVFPAMRAGFDDPTAYDAFESLLRSLDVRRPDALRAADRRRTERELQRSAPPEPVYL